MRLAEGLTIELKRQIVDDIRKTVIAFANTNGGTIYVGIGDSGEVIGVQDVDGDLLKLSNMIRDAVKPDITMFTTYECEVMEGKYVIRITVQKGTESPYYLNGKGLRPEGVFVRQCTYIPHLKCGLITLTPAQISYTYASEKIC
ncbi:MAG: ATP-binding protein [Anaerocolumna sp.]